MLARTHGRPCQEPARRLTLILPPVQPAVYPEVVACPYAGCGGQHVQHWQSVPKPLRDTQFGEVIAQRYRCVRCGRTFRVSPQGVSHDQTSARRKGVAVMFYVPGMSYGAVATALSALGWPLSKVAVYDAVQEAGAPLSPMRATTSPGYTARSTLRNACTGPKCLEMPRASSTG